MSYDRRDFNRLEMIKSMKKPFMRCKEISAKSSAISKRENSSDSLIKRISQQIVDTCSNFESVYEITPEKWDEYFKLLGGGQSMRTSSAILKRMDWNRFLSECEKVVKSL